MERLSNLQASGVDKSDFSTWGGVYVFQCEYAQEYSALPSQDLIKNKWPEWEYPEGDFHYWLQEFIKRSAANKAEALIRNSLEKIQEAPEKFIPELVSKLSVIQYHGNSHVQSTDATADERYDKYELRKQLYEETGGNYLLGISTGLKVIDQTHQGWMDGELIGFYARPTVGKTWMLVREAVIAWAEGKRVLLVSPEVSTKHVALRIDVFMARARGIILSHKKIFAGHPDQEQAYKRATDLISKTERWWTVDSMQGRPLGLRDLRSLIKEFRPDLVCIDGVMLLADDLKGEGYIKMDNVCYGLKNLAVAEDVAILVSHQAVNTQKGRKTHESQGMGDDWRMPTLNDAAGGEAFVRACNTIFTMAPDMNHRNLRWFSVRKSRERSIENWRPRYALGWDVDTGNIVDMSLHGDDLTVIEPMLSQIGGA